MSSKAGSSFATLLLSLPLVALPMMAIFGIPQFSPLIASHSSEQAGEEPPVFPAEDLYRRRAADVLGEPSSPGLGVQFGTAESRPPAGQTGEAPLWNPESAAGSRTATSPGTELFGPSPESAGNSGEWPQSAPPPADRSAAGAAPGESNFPAGNQAGPSARLQSDALPRTGEARGALTWTAAARRLEEMGIDNYHLERGSRHDTFLFVCMFSPGDNPDIVHRFEKESTDPLLAVQDVLDQIDGWLRRRFAQQMRTGSAGTAVR